ncbi:trypsin-like peptidase domain-containing protein [Colwellia sp. UCD-KL20]|uniref:trypsin-like peptidase domain-containing protein n=1 Tax=Colwellia sp. UCD-KL20 TaxID=1917165 RepID=UPI0009712450|nr:trypsin-like peptidase domain-containing protein [Colwellia sp. UCD-KL20]
MKFISSLKYILHSAFYGVVIAIALILLFPHLRDTTFSGIELFNPPAPIIQPLSYAKAVQNAGPAVVNIYSEEIQTSQGYGRKSSRSISLGSGVIMDSAGYILTNYHVVQNANSIIVLLQTGQSLSAELIGFDIFTDLAVLKVNAINLPVIPQREGLISRAGDVVLAIGNPLNLGQTITQGIISATGRTGGGLSITSYLEFLQMDAAINDGNSGGALINTNGELVGINSRKFIDDKHNIQGIFFAVPYKLAHKVMQKIIATGTVTRGWLGVSTNSSRAGGKGIVIDTVESNSPAQKAGLQIGDAIYQIDDETITSVAQALDLVAETPPGDTLVFKIFRRNKLLEVSIMIEEKVVD